MKQRGITIWLTSSKFMARMTSIRLSNKRRGLLLAKKRKSLHGYQQEKKSGEISVSILRSDINPWRTSLFQSGHLSAVTRNGLLMSVLYMTANPRNSAMPLKVKIAKEIHGGTYGN